VRGGGIKRNTYRGFTLIEVLVTLLLVGIVIPTIMHAITSAASAGIAARHRNDAAALAQSQLACLVLAVSQGQTPALAGDFNQDGFAYQWKATVQAWNQDTTSLGIQDIDLTLNWLEGSHSNSMTLSSLAFNQQQGQQ